MKKSESTLKSKLLFPLDDVVKKMVYLFLMEIEKKWTMPIEGFGNGGFCFL